MKNLKELEIEVFRLAEGKQLFNYELDDTFFALMKDSFLEKGNLSVTVLLDKSERLILSEYTIKGTVELVCDRSLEPYSYALDQHWSLVFKFGDEFKEVSEDVVLIPRDLQKLDLSQYIYEFIGLSIPMKKLHPKFKDEEESDEETTLVYRSEDGKKDIKQNEENSEPIDPRWNALKDLKNKLK